MTRAVRQFGLRIGRILAWVYHDKLQHHSTPRFESLCFAHPQRELRLADYSFTLPTVVRALMEAKLRGVNVRIIADIPVRETTAFAIHHDKYVVADKLRSESESFNESQVAARTTSSIKWHGEHFLESSLSVAKLILEWHAGRNIRTNLLLNRRHPQRAC